MLQISIISSEKYKTFEELVNGRIWVIENQDKNKVIDVKYNVYNSGVFNTYYAFIHYDEDKKNEVPD